MVIDDDDDDRKNDVDDDDDGEGSRFLRNVGALSHYTVSHPRRH